MWYRLLEFHSHHEIGVARQPEMLWFLEVKGAWLLPTPFSWAAALNAEGNGFWPFSHLQPGGGFGRSRGVGGSEVFGSFFRVESAAKKPASYYTTTSHPRFKLASNVKKDTVASLIPLGNFLLPQFLVHPRWKYKETTLNRSRICMSANWVTKNKSWNL